MFKRIKLLIGICALTTMLTACSKDMQRHGYNFDDTAVSKIHINSSNVQDVMKTLGSPTASAIYGKPKFFYIEHVYERKSFINPVLREQRILEIGFDTSGVVKEIQSYSTDDMKTLAIAKNFTRLPGNDIGVMEQILGNIGKYNDSSDIRKVGT